MEQNQFDLNEKLSYSPSKIRVKIYVLFDKMHIVKPVKKVVDATRKFRKKLGFSSKYVSPQEMEELKREKAFFDDFNSFLHDIEGYNFSDILPNILFSGYISSFRKGGNLFLHRLLDELEDINLFAVSQSGKSLTERERNKIEFDTLIVPRVPFAGGYDKNLNIHLTTEMIQVIDSKTYLKDAAFNIKSYHDDMGEGYAEALAYYTYIYTLKFIECLNPVCVIVHNKLYSLHDVIVKTCEEVGITTLFFEFGALPGTFALEKQGQMGTSYVATDFEEFKALPVSDEELLEAEKIYDFLRKSRLNRNEQVKKDNSDFWSKVEMDRPIILYAGQNDYDSGICPYTEHAKKYHSPIFETSDQAAIYLAELAEKHNWNFIYKPHPLPVKHNRCLPEGLPENVIWISDIDINEIIDKATVVITILSQVGDISLVRGKPTIMLGYTQLRGKGCAYEAYEKDDIENIILNALENGFTVDQKDAFMRHIAQVNKYYLYDDMTDRKIRYGQTITACAQYVNDEIKRADQTGKKILLYCKNIIDILVSIHIYSQLISNSEVTLLLKYGCREHIKPEELENYFASIIYADEANSEINESYDYLFVSEVGNEENDLYIKLKEKNCNLAVCIYDALTPEQYYYDYKKENSYITENVSYKFTFSREMEIWKKKNWLYKQLKPIQVDNYLKLVRTEFDVPETYVFVESKMFYDKVMCNEMDLLDYIAEIVGKDNIVIKAFSDESKLRFEMRGYRVGFSDEMEWKSFLTSKNIEKKVLIGVYPLGFVSGSIWSTTLKYTEIYLYPLLVGQTKFISSNSFSRFMKAYRNKLHDNGQKIYIINQLPLLKDILNYINQR